VAVTVHVTEPSLVNESRAATVHQNDLNDLKIQNSCVHYVVWRRPDETRLYSTLLMVSHPESCLFRLIINNMIV
jgi:hypothetical protein